MSGSALSGSARGPLLGPPEHPEGLREADRRYLVSWGAREMARTSLIGGAASLGTAALAAAHSPLWLLLLLAVVPLWAFLILFFRNPRRRVPAEAGVLVAPADGRVLEVGPAEEPEYIGGPAQKVAIFLSIFDVHVNRAPCSGEVEHLRHREGRFLDARDPRSARENEAHSIGLRSTEASGPARPKVLVLQVAGAIARRIVCPLQVGQRVARGGLIGMIKYGSRTEIFVSAPPGGPAPEPQVKVGDKVVGGETVLFRMGREPERQKP